MPIYEYFCPQCKNEFELRFSFSEANCTPLCPKCYSVVERLTSSFACKTGGNIQAAEKPYRKGAAPELSATKEAGATPPSRIELLSPPEKRSIRARHKKK